MTIYLPSAILKILSHIAGDFYAQTASGHWGILYLLTPIWTFFIMRTDAGSYVGAINSILPALMGIFTTWFQKWYPKYVASGK